MLLRANNLMTIVWIIVFCCDSNQLSTIDRNRPKPSINSRQTLECHRREYTFKATRTDSFGRQCWEYITVMSCWGRCDSGEVGHSSLYIFYALYMHILFAVFLPVVVVLIAVSSLLLIPRILTKIANNIDSGLMCCVQ